MPASYPEEINYRDYLRVILKRKWLILAALIITVSTTTIETFTMKPVYRATEELLIERENPKVLDIGQVLGLDANNRDYYQTQYGILKSKALALKVIKALHLQESTEFRPKKTGISLSGLFHSAISGLKKMLSYGKQKEVTEEDAEARRYSGLIKAYLARLHVDPIRNSRLVDIAFDGNDPRLASQIIRTHARLYIESNLERKFNMSKQAVEWLREKVKEARVKLKESEVALQNYRVKKGLASIGFEKKHSIIIKTLDQLNDALNTARIDRLQKQALYNQLKKIADKPEMIEALPAVVSSPLIQQLKLSYISLMQKYNNLRQKYGPQHPKMVRLSSQINAIRNSIRKEINNIAESMRVEYQAAVSKQNSIKSAMENQKKQALELSRKRIEYNVLKRMVEVNRTLYESLLKRLKEANVGKSLRMTNISVVTPARVPVNPVKPKKALDIFLSIVVGLGIGLGFAFLLEYLDNTIQSPEDIERYLDIPLLGVIGKINLESENPGNRVELVTVKDPKSTISENFRIIRTNLLFTSPDAERKAFLITSALPYEGKSLVAANLASAFSQMDKKVLLIDADLRMPRVHKIFGLDNKVGLSGYLAGDRLEIQEDTIKGLHILPSGPIPPNPAELLASGRIREMLKKLRESFEIIIIDSPPLLSLSDAAQLAPIVEGTVIVIKGSETPRPAVQRAIQELSKSRSKIAGCILNSVDFKKQSYYSDYYYYDYYSKYKRKGTKKHRSATS